VPSCPVCGQAEHKAIDGLLDHCRTCRQPVFAGTSYWIWRRARVLVDYYYCLECIAWNPPPEDLFRRVGAQVQTRRTR